ncbi:MAG: acyltransferase family protein [Lachnospiraceae bacterium]|nr:acyltransferase family protein [Lachnospiraceae bacterium]
MADFVSRDTDRNRTMGILTGIAIILVVLGHLDMNELSVFGLFPYYSFHVCIFLFVSGYFYKPESETGVFKFIGRKALRLLLPYYICNLIYGIISTVLSKYGFTFCQPISLRNLFIEPFLGGHQFGLNFASWFVPALFIVEVINILARRFLTLIRLTDELLLRIHTDRDVIMFVCTLAAGIATVYLAQGGHVWGLYKTPGRILFMIPVYELGILYRSHLEEYDKRIPDAVCLGALCAVQLIIYSLSEGLLNFSVVWCTSFASYAWVPYATTVTGTWLWLRIARMITDSSPGHALDRIGASSFHIMMHHVAVFRVIDLIMYGLSLCIKDMTPPDMTRYLTDAVYVYLPGDMYPWKCVYLAAGILIPVFIRSLVVKRETH